MNKLTVDRIVADAGRAKEANPELTDAEALVAILVALVADLSVRVSGATDIDIPLTDEDKRLADACYATDGEV